MSAIAFATIDDYDTHQLRGSEKDSQLQFRLDSARDRIISCLYKGKYNVSAILLVIAGGDSFAVLKELNIVMAHIRIISGASASEVSDSSGKTYLKYVEWVDDTTKNICEGLMAFTSGSGEDVFSPPKMSVSLGIVGDDRHSAIDLNSPVNWGTASVLKGSGG